jgi:hypothetical protein
MTAYTLAANANLRDIGNAGIWGSATARTSADTIDTNGFVFTQDQDSRYGLSGNTSAVWGSLTVNASKGGQLNFDGTKVWMIPFTGGSGTLTLGTQITIGGVTCNTIGIYTSLTVAPAATGASGWLKVTNASATPGTISSGTYAGFTLTANGAAVRGFIEVVGQEAGTINANRLGSVNITGAWFELGTTSGASNQTVQIPNNGLTCWHPGVFIETAASSGVFEFYPNNGLNTTTGTDSTRGKCVWIDNTGLVRIGNSGAATNGFTPASGLRIVIGNVFFNNAVTTLTANTIPNATVATRYDFTTSGGGVVNIDKCSMMWYLSCSQAYSVTVTNSGFSDSILLSEVATAMTLTKVGVGNKPTTALVANPLTLTYCYAGGTFTDCVWWKSSGAAAGVTNTYQDIAGFTFVRDKQIQGVIRGIATSHAMSVTRAVNCTWTNPTIVQGSIQLITCNGITITDTVYCDAVSGTTVTTYAMYVFNVSSNTINCTFSGLTFPVTNTHPYTAILIGASGCNNIKLRNIGTYAAPLTMGSANACGLVYTLGTSCSDFKIQRVYVANTRTGIMTGDNSCIRVTEESVWGDYADAVDVMAILNHKRKGMGGTGAVTAQTAVYGTHFSDGHTSTTAGRIAILMNESNALTTAQVTLTNGSAFTSAGGLYMPTIGMTATFETPDYIIGHTGFSATAGTMAGGTVGNYRFEYSIDKNDGGGWSALTASAYTAATLATAMNAITGISAVNGFKLRLKVSTTTGNTTAITSFYMLTTSTTTTQAYQYPLDTNTLTLTGLVSGSDVVINTNGTNTTVGEVDAGGTTFAWVFSGAQTVDIKVMKAGYMPHQVYAYVLTAADASLPIAQVVDRTYI